MPLTIGNHALYHDRTVQDWHRDTLPSSFMAIDLDLMGVCPRCKDPLYGIEATTNPNKPVTILRQLAVKADMAGIVAMHDTETITGFRVVRDQNDAKVSLNPLQSAEMQLNQYIHQLRRQHVCGRGR